MIHRDVYNRIVIILRVVGIKIKRIELIPVKITYKRPVPIHVGINEAAENLIVKIISEDGEIGLGEVSPLIPSYSGETQETALLVIYKVLGPHLIGKNPMDIENIWNLMNNLLVGHTCAKGGLDFALHDLKAKLLDVPIYDLLGGKFRDKLPVLWTVSWWNGKEGMVKEALDYVDRGYKHLKLKIGSEIKDDLENVKAVKNSIPENVTLIADANQAYTPKEAVNVVNRLKDYIEILEQPVPKWDILGSKFVAEKSDIPIMADEAVPTPEDAENYARLNACNMFLNKLMRDGGFHPSKKKIEIAKANNIGCIACSMTELGIGTAANAHFAASTEYLSERYGFGFDGPLQIFSIIESEGFEGDIVLETPLYKKGFLHVPEGKGLGVELNERNVGKYRNDKIRIIK